MVIEGHKRSPFYLKFTFSQIFVSLKFNPIKTKYECSYSEDANMFTRFGVPIEKIL